MTRSPTAWLRTTLSDPSAQVDLVQILKSVVAAVVAWMLAVHVFELAQPFLAPWTALLTVHATVYRSFWRGAQTVLATAIGILVSFLAVATLGEGAITLAAALLVGMVLSRLGVVREEGVTVATTALFVLTTGYEQQESMLLDRFLDVAVGVSVGVLANLLVLPPLHDRSARRQVDAIDARLGRLLGEMAREMRSDWSEEHSSAWIDATRDIDGELDQAWAWVRHAHEAGLGNPRRRIRGRASAPQSYAEVLRRLEEGIAQTRSMARVIHESTRTAQDWDPRFREPWLDLLEETGHRVEDREADVSVLRGRLHRLTEELSREELAGLHWPVYGALITHLTQIVEVVDDVATAQPVRT